MNNKVLLVTPKSMQYYPPDRIACLDLAVSQKYNDSINNAVCEKLGECVNTYNAFSGRYCVNIGLLMLGSALKKKIGNGSVSYAFGDYFDTIESFVEAVVEMSAGVSIICFTSTTPQIMQVELIAQKCKERNRRIRTILGGPHTFQFSNTPISPCFDAVIIGSNLTMASEMISSCLSDNTDVFDICSFNYQDYLIDFTAIPEHLLKETMLYTFTSYGCPRLCEYCMEHKICDNVRFLSIPKKIQEIEFIVKQGNTKFVHLADSDFLINLHHAEAFVSALSNAEINACYSINLTPQSIIRGDYRKVIEKFVRLGLVEVLIGVEHTSETVLRGVGKPYDRIRFAEELKYLKRTLGMPIISLYTLVGLPFEGKDQIDENIKVITAWKNDRLFDYTFPKFFVPYPGTDIYQTPEKYGAEITSYNFSEYQRWSLPRPIRIKGMSDDSYISEVEQLYKLML